MEMARKGNVTIGGEQKTGGGGSQIQFGGRDLRFGSQTTCRTLKVVGGFRKKA